MVLKVGRYRVRCQPSCATAHTHTTFFVWPGSDSGGKLFEQIWQLSERFEQGAVHGHLTLPGKDFSLALNSALHTQDNPLPPPNLCCLLGSLPSCI